jgi:hypothetical protein
MDALQADASAIPDDSVDHVANALVNKQVTAPAAATVPASTPVFCRPDQCSLTNSYVDDNSC